MKAAASPRTSYSRPAPSLVAFIVVALALLAMIFSLLPGHPWHPWPAIPDIGEPLGGFGATPLPPSL